jgi:hypothetical protein
MKESPLNTIVKAYQAKRVGADDYRISEDNVQPLLKHLQVPAPPRSGAVTVRSSDPGLRLQFPACLPGDVDIETEWTYYRKSWFYYVETDVATWEAFNLCDWFPTIRYARNEDQWHTKNFTGSWWPTSLAVTQGMILARCDMDKDRAAYIFAQLCLPENSWTTASTPFQPTRKQS